jgi:membrane protease YdiL (CAAX protease family)
MDQRRGSMREGTSTPRTPHREGLSVSRSGGVAEVRIPQYSIWQVFGVWAAAALPMGALAWLVAPALADRFSGQGNLPLAKALLLCLAIGLIWQFVLVVILVGGEQRTLRWSTIREALWLRSPRSPRSGRGGRVWLILIPLIVAFAAQGFLPDLWDPGNRDLPTFLESDAGQSFFSGNWAWFGLIVVNLLFNTVLGEELLFRGLLLPRMNGAFGRGDWLANGVLFAVYHLHIPWAMLAPLTDAFVIAYPTKYYRSAWIGIAVHSAQSVLIAVVLIMLVLR